MSKLTSVKKKIHYKLQITNYLLQSIEEVPILSYRVYIISPILIHVVVVLFIVHNI